MKKPKLFVMIAHGGGVSIAVNGHAVVVSALTALDFAKAIERQAFLARPIKE